MCSELWCSSKSLQQNESQLKSRMGFMCYVQAPRETEWQTSKGNDHPSINVCAMVCAAKTVENFPTNLPWKAAVPAATTKVNYNVTTWQAEQYE
eukprot:1198695-Amphidinium_carterae.1